MRKQCWIAPVIGMLAAAAFGQSATAQGPGSPLDANFPPVRPRPMAPGPVAPGPMAYPGQPTYTPVAPDAASPAGFPPKMEAWPTISAFEHAFEQTYNDNGIWFREQLNHQRTYQVNVEFISANFRELGNTAVGSDSVIGTQGEHYGEAINGIDAFDIYTVKDAFVFASTGRYLSPDSELEYPDGAAQSGNPPRPINFETVFPGNQAGEDAVTLDFTFARPRAGLVQVVNFEPPGPNADIEFETEMAKTVLYPVNGDVLDSESVVRFGGEPDVVGQTRQNPNSPGLRIQFGLEEEDDRGFLWSGYWINGQPDVFRRGLDDPTRPVLTNIVFFDAPHLGTGSETSGLDLGANTNAVEVLDYNTLFELEHETEAGGTDLAFYHTPFVDLGWLRMRPLFGARYDYVRESFRFTGRDNGFAYAYDQDGDTFADGEEDNGGGVTETRIPVLGSDQIPLTVEDPINLTQIFPYETTVNSQVKSHLYGPQVGFDMQLGGEHFMLSTVTKTGVVVDTERLELDTTGFGSQEALTGVRPSSSDAKTHTRVVPFLEFNANADINVFPIIPVVNRWEFLKNARIRAGWTALVFGNMQRPLDQVVWRASESGGSYIREGGHEAWYVNYWNLGVHWSF